MKRIIFTLFAIASFSTGALPYATLRPLRTFGTSIQTIDGNPVLLRGVNCASMEWTSDGEGHIMVTVKNAIENWHANIIRLPLSQDRWFGHGSEQSDGGVAYRNLVRNVVKYCAKRRCYIILDLHWSDQGIWGFSIGQHKMPDQNSLAFWQDFAPNFANNPAVIFDLYNEPHDISWNIWRYGGSVTETGTNGRTYTAVGMQQLLDAVRATGAMNLAIVGGLDWSYDYSGILSVGPLNDPTGNGVLYANHAYPFKGDTVAQWQNKMSTAAAILPVIVDEWGSDTAGGAGMSGAQWVSAVLNSLRSHHYSYVAWDLHPAAGPVLISDWNYTPTSWFGVPVKADLAGP